jgi:hypothetical protein
VGCHRAGIGGRVDCHGAALVVTGCVAGSDRCRNRVAVVPHHRLLLQTPVSLPRGPGAPPTASQGPTSFSKRPYPCVRRMLQAGPSRPV